MFDLVFDEEYGTKNIDVGTSSQGSMGPATIHSVHGVENDVIFIGAICRGDFAPNNETNPHDLPLKYPLLPRF